MTKAKYVYELIDQGMLISCQNNIWVETLQLKDEIDFYKSIEQQFMNCLKFYDDMKALYENGIIDKAMMEHELKTVLILMRQKAVRMMRSDVARFLEKCKLSKKDKNEILEKLDEELMKNTIDAEFLLEKMKELHKFERNDAFIVCETKQENI